MDKRLFSRTIKKPLKLISILGFIFILILTVGGSSFLFLKYYKKNHVLSNLKNLLSNSEKPSKEKSSNKSQLIDSQLNKRQSNENLPSEAFSKFRQEKLKLLNYEQEVSLIAVGDISYSRGVGRMISLKKDINFPFLKTKELLSKADIVYGNLETPITQGREIQDGEMIFRSNPGTENALKWAGFNLVNLANNHTLNFGSVGIKDTIDYLKKAGIKTVGAGKNNKEALAPVFIEKNGIKFAFLAYEDTTLIPSSYEATDSNPGIAFMNISQMADAVKTAKKQADLVVVFMHAGIEYTPKPNFIQTNFAHSAIDAGADMVIGDHPHVVQIAELYKDKYIFYNLGNFVLDQMWSSETRQGLIMKSYFNKSGVTKFYFQPTQIEAYSQPTPVYGSLAENIVKRLEIPVNQAYKLSVLKSSDSKKTAEFSIKKIATIMNPKNKSESNLKLDNKKSVILDIDSDSNNEAVLLENGTIEISRNSKSLWKSPNTWWVDDFSIADSTGDGKLKVNLSVWKEGNYGDAKPQWVKENDMSIKNHMFVFKFENNTLKPVWQSSNLSAPNCFFKFEEVDNDLVSELITIEGDYTDSPNCIGNYIAVWKWHEWGFENIWRSEKGLYDKDTINL